MDSYIFSGIGFAPAKYKITNSDIEAAIKKSYLGGFNESRVAAGESYTKYHASGGNLSPFEFLAEKKNGV
jgi:hypothetical protein